VRILSISGENVASLGRFTVRLDQEPLRSAGIFAIVGPTGAGKSSLLDALCLALYHQVPRLADAVAQGITFPSALGAVSVRDAAHLVRRGTRTAFAEVEFVAGDGVAYRAHWGYRAPKRKGAASQEETWLADAATGKILFDRKKECAERIQELLGLDFAQFTRTVLLAQGQFAAFLKSNVADERATILERLTGTELYARIGKAIAERKGAETHRLDELRERRQALPLLGAEERAAAETARARVTAELLAIAGSAERVEGARQLALERQRVEAEAAAVEPALAEATAQIEALEPQVAARAGAQAALEQRWQALQPALDRAIELDARIATLSATLAAQGDALARQRQAQLDREAQLVRAREDLARRERELGEREEWLAAQAHLAPLARERRFVAEQLSCYLAQHRRRRELGERIEQVRVGLPAAVAAEEDVRRRLAEVAGRLVGVEVARLPGRLEELARRERQLELGGAIAAARQRRDDAARVAAGLASGLAAANERVEHAERAYGAGAEVAEGAVARLRARLEEGQPCPVCGATSHPYRALTEAALREQVEALRSERAAAVAERDALREQEQRARAVQAQAVEELTRLEPALEALRVEDPEVLACVTPDAVAALRARLQARLEASQALPALELELEQSSGELRRLRESLAHLEEEARSSEDGRAEAERKLAPLWAVAEWRAPLEARGEPFLEEQRAALEQHAVTEQAVGELRLALAPLARAVEGQEAEVKAVAAALQRQDEQHAALRKEVEVVAEERRQVLEGEPVALVRARWQDELEAARRARTELEAALGQAREARTGLANRRQAARDAAAQAARSLAELGPACAQALAPLALDAGPAPVDFAAAPGAELLAWLTRVQRGLDARREALQVEGGALAERLRQDDERRAEGTRLDGAIAAQQEVAGRWEQLYQLLGVGEGKAFRALAQQLSLELLLVQTNRHLTAITPRYELRQLPASMHFVVVDHDGYDAERPVHTLSGGETFLVSLALALGLSALVSGGHAIETLFIDEGFGSLDGDTLRHVMRALDALHSQGRKVGLVTHVEEMKERIPVRVEVRRVGPGLSEVCLVG